MTRNSKRSQSAPSVKSQRDLRRKLREASLLTDIAGAEKIPATISARRFNTAHLTGSCGAEKEAFLRQIFRVACSDCSFFAIIRIMPVRVVLFFLCVCFKTAN